MGKGLDFGSIAEGLAGLVLPGVGGVLAGLGMDILGGATGALGDAQNAVTNNLGKLATANLYNAAGRTGEATKSSFDNALNSLSNSAEARRASADNNNMAFRMLSQGQQSIDDVNRNAQRSMGSTIRQTGQVARDRGIGAGGLASVANQINDSTSQTLSQAGQQQTQSGMQATAGAGELSARSSQILNQDLANRNDIFVKPFYAQSSGIGNAAVNSMPNIFSTLYDEKAAYQPMAGFSAALGRYGNRYGGRYFNDQSADDARGAYNGGFNAKKDKSKTPSWLDWVGAPSED
jgi:hypothetical protein